MTSGRTVRSLRGHDCFLPAPLDDWGTAWSRETRQAIEAATHALGLAQGPGRLLPNPDLLTLASLDKEALASSTIENTIASPEEFILFQAIGGPARDATIEVANYRTALQSGVELLQTLPISTRLILELHKWLLTRTSKAHMAGRLKSEQNYIASERAASIQQATFVPPPPEETPDLLDDLWNWIHGDSPVERVARVAMAHYQFETIHPFGDGNGRVGRLLVVIQMLDLRLLDSPCVYPSLYLERRKDEYIDRLQAVRTRNDLDQWVGFFATALGESARETVRLAESINETVEQLRLRQVGVRRRAALQATIDAFSRRLFMTASELAQAASVSEPTAQACLRELEHVRTVTELTGKRRGRVYVCQPLFEAIFGSGPSAGLGS